MLSVSEINVYYEALHVLKNVTLRVAEAELVALFGPNGHGKSTLLKAIAGIQPAAYGRIEFRGLDITRLAPHRIVRLGISYIPESRDLFPDMSVEENLRMGAYTLKSRSELKNNLSLAYELFPRLAERRKQLASSLSGGESRMVAIGRGLMSSARMLLVDEPSIGLSPALRKQVFSSLRKVKEEARITVLVVEQEIGEALALADRVYVLNKGHILFESPAAKIDLARIERAYFVAEEAPAAGGAGGTPR